MDIVYSDATVTLFVTSGISADGGIFSRSHTPWTCAISVPRVQVGGTSTKETFSVRAEVSNDEERDGLGYPWNSRGWTMQEYISAPRGIVYTDSQMGWFCLTHAKKGTADWMNQENELARILDGMASTTVLNDNFEHISHFWRAFMRSEVLDSLVASRKHLQDSITHQFYAIPNELSNRRFTYESDKLEAVANIVKTTELKLLKLRFAEIEEGDISKKWRVNPPKYWAGLWDDDWAYGFFWKEEKEGIRCKNQKQVLARPEGEPCVPSWSWASVLYSRHQSFPDSLGSAPSSHIRNVITPKLSDVNLSPIEKACRVENARKQGKAAELAALLQEEVERFVPTKPLPLRLTVPLLRLSKDWNTPKLLLKASYNVSTGLEARVRELFHISWDWASFLGDPRYSEHRKRKSSPTGEQQVVIIQVLSLEVTPACFEEAFYLVLERVQPPQGSGDSSNRPKTTERYRRIASLSQRGVLPVKDAQGVPRDWVKSWREKELKRAEGRIPNDYLHRNKFEPTKRELMLSSLLELVRREPWPEIDIELV